jgi:microcystin-dependent protein
LDNLSTENFCLIFSIMDQYIDLAMIFLFGSNFAPQGFAFCAGQTLAISSNTALFSLLGTTYGGDGTTTFILPDLRGRVPVGQGQGPNLNPYTLGQSAGIETVALTTAQLPAHSHPFNVSNAAGTTGVPGTTTYLSQAPSTGSGPNATVESFYTTTAANTTLNAGAVGNTGSGTAVSILQPYLVISYVIAIQGIFPSRN